MFYNLAFTSLPVIFMGIMDQDVNDVVSLLVPQLYRAGIMRSEWNQTKFWGYMFDGLYQSVICFFFPYLVYYKTGLVTPNGLGLDHRYWVGIIVTTIAALSCNLYVLIHQYRWDWFSSLFIFLSIIIVFGWTGIWSSSTNSGEFYKSAARVYGSPMFWAVMFVGILFCLLPRFTFDVFQKLFFLETSTLSGSFGRRGTSTSILQITIPLTQTGPKSTKQRLRFIRTELKKALTLRAWLVLETICPATQFTLKKFL